MNILPAPWLNSPSPLSSQLFLLGLSGSANGTIVSHWELKMNHISVIFQMHLSPPSYAHCQMLQLSSLLYSTLETY